MRNKELKIEAWTTSKAEIEEISKASLPVSADLNNEFASIVLKTDQRKIYPS